MQVPAGFITGTGVNDNDVLFTLDHAESFDTFMLMSTDGAVDVQVSLDGSNYNTGVALSLTDMGATTSTPVLLTAADRMYGFRGKFRKVRVLQNGATASAATMSYGVMT